MNFTLVRGKDFSEVFDFKNQAGKSIALPNGQFKVVLERGTFAKEFTVLNGGLSRLRNRVTWTISANDTADFDFATMYYTLYLDDSEITRGILRIQ